MTKRTITETQFMELRQYDEHTHRWVNGGPLKSLVANGLIRPAASQPGFYEITPAGAEAVEAFRAKYGIR